MDKLRNYGVMEYRNYVLLLCQFLPFKIPSIQNSVNPILHSAAFLIPKFKPQKQFIKIIDLAFCICMINVIVRA